MTYFYDILEFPESSRLTGIWDNRSADAPVGGEIASGHFIRLPDDQHVELEGDFLTAHMPFWVAGFGGVFPDGRPWLFVLQTAPADAAATLMGSDDPFWVLRDSLFRALRFNDGAAVTEEFLWTHDDLLQVYRWIGVPDGAVEHWPVIDLLRGLMTECCYASLSDVVDGYAIGCAFPGIEHDCTRNALTDVFARWGSGLMPSPSSGDVESDEEWDDEIELTADDLVMLRRRDLEAIARECGIRVRRRKSRKPRSRRRLIELILETGEEMSA